MSDRPDHIHEGALAVEAAIAIVEAVRGTLHLGGLGLGPVESPLGREIGAFGAFEFGERRRDSGDHVAVRRTESGVGDMRQECRIGAAGERDHHGSEFEESSTQGLQRVVETAIDDGRHHGITGSVDPELREHLVDRSDHARVEGPELGIER